MIQDYPDGKNDQQITEKPTLHILTFENLRQDVMWNNSVLNRREQRNPVCAFPRSANVQPVFQPGAAPLPLRYCAVQLCCPGWLQAHDSPASTSRVAKSIGTRYVVSASSYLCGEWNPVPSKS